jgi:hypothetical protein
MKAWRLLSQAHTHKSILDKLGLAPNFALNPPASMAPRHALAWPLPKLSYDRDTFLRPGACANIHSTLTTIGSTQQYIDKDRGAALGRQPAEVTRTGNKKVAGERRSHAAPAHAEQTTQTNTNRYITNMRTWSIEAAHGAELKRYRQGRCTRLSLVD